MLDQCRLHTALPSVFIMISSGRVPGFLQRRCPCGVCIHARKKKIRACQVLMPSFNGVSGWVPYTSNGSSIPAAVRRCTLTLLCNPSLLALIPGLCGEIRADVVLSEKNHSLVLGAQNTSIATFNLSGQEFIPEHQNSGTFVRLNEASFDTAYRLYMGVMMWSIPQSGNGSR